MSAPTGHEEPIVRDGYVVDRQRVTTMQSQLEKRRRRVANVPNLNVVVDPVIRHKHVTVAVQRQIVDAVVTTLNGSDTSDELGGCWIGQIDDVDTATGVVAKIAEAFVNLDSLYVERCAGGRVPRQVFGRIGITDIEDPNPRRTVPRRQVGIALTITSRTFGDHIGVVIGSGARTYDRPFSNVYALPEKTLRRKQVKQHCPAGCDKFHRRRVISKNLDSC